jgi:DNA polymerase
MSKGSFSIWVGDIESTFSNEHTLRKLSIEEYIRHPKFELIGLGIKNTETGWKSFLTGNDVGHWLKEHRHIGFIAHHAQFDLFALSHLFDYQPSFIFDTLSMSRALYQHLPSHSLDKLVAHFNLGTPKTVPYNEFRGKTLAEIDARLLQTIGDGCLHDLFLTHQLYELLVHQMPADELELIDETIRLYTEPVLVGDVPLLTDALTEAIIAREHKMHEMGLTDKVLKSDAKFATLLRGCGIEPPTKISATTGREAFAFAKTDLDFQSLQEHPNARVRDLVEARVAAKTSIHETRAGRLLSTAERGAIPVYLKYYGAHTGRFSGGDKSNLQNLPRNSKLRSGLLAPNGYTLAWGDLSQIEFRLTAWLAGCEDLLEAFRENRDVYSEDATDFFGVEVTREINKELRRLMKETDLGCGYGMGKEKFAYYLESKGIKIERSVSDGMVEFFRRKRREIPDLWRKFDGTLSRLKKYGVVDELFGPVSWIGHKIIGPNGLFLDYEGDNLDRIWGGTITENVIQFLARIVLTDAWLKVRREFAARAGCYVVTSTHDELVCCVPLADKEWALDMLGTALVTVPEWAPDLPLAAELFHGSRYDKGECAAISRTSEEN